MHEGCVYIFKCFSTTNREDFGCLSMFIEATIPPFWSDQIFLFRLNPTHRTLAAYQPHNAIIYFQKGTPIYYIYVKYLLRLESLNLNM